MSQEMEDESMDMEGELIQYMDEEKGRYKEDKNKRIKCEICDQYEGSANMVLTHIKKTHPEEYVKIDKDSFLCQYCKLAFKNKSMLRHQKDCKHKQLTIRENEKSRKQAALIERITSSSRKSELNSSFQREIQNIKERHRSRSQLSQMQNSQNNLLESRKPSQILNISQISAIKQLNNANQQDNAEQDVNEINEKIQKLDLNNNNSDSKNDNNSEQSSEFQSYNESRETQGGRYRKYS